MQQTEKQAIEDSLRRNEGKRKAAAAELRYRNALYTAK